MVHTIIDEKVGIANNGGSNTYRKVGMDSIIGITFARCSLLSKVSGELAMLRQMQMRNRKKVQNFNLTGPN